MGFIRESWYIVLIGVFLIVVLCGLLAMIPYLMYAEKECLSRGWKESSVTWDLTIYCIREENEYEIVRPLSEIE